MAIANPKTRAIASSRVVCDLPEGVEIVAVNTNLLWNTKKSERIRRDGKPYARHRIEVRPSRDTIPKGKLMNCWYARYQPPSLWLTTDLPAGARPGRLYVRLAYREGDAEAESPESWVDIAVLPPLKADTPKIVRTGVMGRAPCAITPYENDDYKDQARLIGTYLRQMGFNLQMCEIHPSLSPPGLTRWTEGRNVNQIDNKGFRHNEREPVGVGNGFFIHLEPEKRGAIPAEVQRLDGGGQRQTGGMMAPWAIYRRHPWIQQHVLDVIARSVERGDYEVLWANWEPRMSEQDRDYSDGSKREFVKWSKLPEDEVERLWLDELIRKYPKNWWHFRNWELGQVVRIYSDVVREAGARTGRDTRFMICMPQDMMMIDDNVEPYAWQGLRWGDMPIIMQTWSYHNTPRSDRRFPKIDKMAHYLVRRSGWVRRYVDQQLGPDRQVQLGCVYGWEQTGGRAGFFVPEDLALRHLAIAMAGLDVTINYAEWTVWDGRYATEMARVNTRIARWERFTLMGKTQSKHVLVPASPYPQQISEDATPSDQLMDGGWPGGGYLQSYEYEQDDKRLIAVINNWHFGDCFLKLKADDLDEGGKYVLWEPEEGRAYANAKGDVALSAGDLADGLLVHVGSTRCGAFLIERFDRTRAYGRIVQPREVRDAMLRRRDALEAGVSRSAEYQ
ncbi:MAG: hypothetical protein CMJ18_25370 [Phycisphaeraceae bacterium]|nr:hypothetical protein [Phycisphaeraceae bacterium]